MDCRCLVHLQLLCSISRFLASSLFFFLSFDFSLIFLVLLSILLFPVISVAASPRTAMVMGLGKMMDTAIPPVIMTDNSSVFPNTLNFFFLMSLFILPRVLPIVSLSFRIPSSV